MTGRFDARELFRVLNEHEVDYVTIGGIAVQAHGGQRVTPSRDDLLVLKRAAGRPQDLADIRLLESLGDGSK